MGLWLAHPGVVVGLCATRCCSGAHHVQMGAHHALSILPHTVKGSHEVPGQWVTLVQRGDFGAGGEAVGSEEGDAGCLIEVST